LTVDELFAIRFKLDKLWARAERTGLATAKVKGSRYGSAYTTFDSLLGELADKLSHITDEAISLRDEAEEV
jgi:hypothetical protein